MAPALTRRFPGIYSKFPTVALNRLLMNEKGKIRVFTGEGKGKTTAALGLAWQAVGRGKRVLMIQFLKAPETSGEHFAAASMSPMITIKPMGRRGFILRRHWKPLDMVMAEFALSEARSAMLSGDYDMIILDEINVAIYLDLIDVEDLLLLIDSKPESLELILTGRYAAPAVMARADSVVEMRKIKHHFDKGVAAREGIEY